MGLLDFIKDAGASLFGRGRDEKVRKLVTDLVSRKKLTFLNLLDPKAAAAEEVSQKVDPLSSGTM